MERCLYTQVELNQNSPPDVHSASLEHIVPYALGGTASFGIGYCSKKANNEFGRTIDAPFIALPTIGFERHALGLKNYSGHVPEIIFEGQCPELQKRCRIIFPFGGHVYADFGTQVSGSLKDQRMAFSGSENRVRKAVASLLKKASRKGYAVLNEQLQPTTDIDDIFEAAKKETGEILHFQVDFGWQNFYVPWSRGLIKMALGLGAYALGRTWAFSAEADILRSSLICKEVDFSSQPLRGTTTSKIHPDVTRIIDIQPGRHTLAVLPHQYGMAAFISLFGGKTLDAIIDLGGGPADVKTIHGELPAEWECVFHIDPVTRTLKTMTLADVESGIDPHES